MTMFSFFNFFQALSFFSFFLPASCVLPPSKLEGDKAKILDMHNEKRRQVDPPATNMKDLKWDAGLASLAQAWSDRCDFEHGNVPEIKDVDRPDGEKYGNVRGTGPRFRTGTGQNLATGSPSISIKTAIKFWDAEKKDYDYCSNSKSRPKAVIGHYTQVVWAKSEYVGCGKTSCRTSAMEKKYRSTLKSPVTSGDLITCNYWPQGNFNGEKPYESSFDCSKQDQENQLNGVDSKYAKSSNLVIVAVAAVVTAFALNDAFTSD